MNNAIVIQQGFVGVLYEDGAFVRVLDAGRHPIKKRWFRPATTTVVPVDVRERSITLKGQEILTADKVAIRVSLLVYFRVTEPTDALHNVASYEERIYEDVQLAARRFLANRKLEEILSDRNEISNAVRDDVKSSATGYGVEIVRADVKDLVFPGNLREIMNQVLETERKAEAEIIRARKDAEAAQIKAESSLLANRLKLESEMEQARMQADVERQRAKLTLEVALERAHQDAELDRRRAELKLALDLDQAAALRNNPELLKLRELQALSDMAQAGARFAIGLRTPSATSLFASGDERG